MFLLAEDNAIKTKLQGLSINTRNGVQPVKVFFGAPDEDDNTRTYPFIQIDLVNLIHDTSREHRGNARLNYIPDTPDGGASYVDVPNATLLANWPIPYLFEYQITTWSRSALQNRQIDAQILANTLRPRYGYVTIPEDNTVRRLDLISTMPAHTMEGQKRLFRTIYTCQISSELFVNTLQTVMNTRQVTIIGGQSTENLNKANSFQITGTVRGQAGFVALAASSSITAIAS